MVFVKLWRTHQPPAHFIRSLIDMHVNVIWEAPEFAAAGYSYRYYHRPTVSHWGQDRGNGELRMGKEGQCLGHQGRQVSWSLPLGTGV
ncbi:hypothetical protein BaRGS_00022441 [Batillaria attramentaria]|uniref:Uncharacterized protein n=1 Tax=Batillaria attramentaria TaxID=370345 RepID=A0ABD0KGV8_9CAEN